MAHFAEIDENNIVLRVVNVNDPDTLDEHGVENEEIGKAFLHNTYGGNWIQTSYNSRIRKRFAGPGLVYDNIRDAFIPPQKYQSWTLDETTLDWVPPTPWPSDPKRIKTWEWREEQQIWEETTPEPPVKFILLENV